VPGRHRFVFDAPYPDGLSSALQFINNYYNLNVSEYGLKESDSRSFSSRGISQRCSATATPSWAKYGKPIADRINLVDPKTKQPPTANMYKDRFDTLIKRGLQIAVCQQATRGNAGAIAMATGQMQDAVFEELKANLLPTRGWCRSASSQSTARRSTATRCRSANAPRRGRSAF
jgi:hypothetical protein